MSLNTVTLTGRIGNDPEIKQFESGHCKATASLAVDEFGREDQKQTHWIPLEAWGKTAEILAKHATKGKQIGVQGSLKADAYEDKDGNNRKRLYVKVDRVELLSTKQKESVNSGSEGDEV